MLRLMPILEHMRACKDSRDWVRIEDYATFAEVWDACERPDWMRWLTFNALPKDVYVRAWYVSKGIHGIAGANIIRSIVNTSLIEAALVEYAHKHGCAVEVAP